MADPDYSSVSLLLPCDDGNGSTTIVDRSSSPKTVSVFGNAQVTTSRSKWGSGSLALDGSGDYITAPITLNIRTQSFTLECWSYLTSTANAAFFASQDAFYAEILSGTFYVGDGSTNNIVLGSNGIVADTWQHIALTFDGTTYRFFVDGVLKGSSITLLASNNLSTLYYGGRVSQGLYSAGNMDDIRVTVGVARYTAEFTPPAEAFYFPNPLIAGQGTLNVAGLTPSLSAGFADTAGQGALSVSGLTPKHSSTTFLGTAGHGNLTVTGLQPSLALGFAATAGQGALAVNGLQPSIAVGFADTAGQGALTVSGLTPKHSSTTFLGTAGQGDLTVSGLRPSIAFGFAAAPPVGQLTISGLTPGFANRILHPIANHWISTHYLCVLTGSADALPDLPLPISSFQTRMGADPFRVYLSVILPNADAYIAAINARPNGRLKVTRVYNYLDGSFQSFTMAEAPFDTLSTNAGGKSGTTGTLTGYETLVAATAQSVTLYDPITRSGNTGGRRYRCRIDPRLRPLDTAVINGESFLVDNVLHIIDTQTAIMEISEKL